MSIRFPISRGIYGVLLLSLLAAACKKSASGTSQVLVHNALLNTADLTVQWNGISMTPTALAQGKTSGTAAAPYVGVYAGTNQLVMKSGTTVLLQKNIYGAPAGHFSMLVYSSSLTATTPNVLLLTDDLSAVDSVNHAKLRFIDCAPDSLALDVLLVSPVPDTVAIISQSFVGATPNPSSYQAFGTLAWKSYTPYIYQSGKELTSPPLYIGKPISLSSKGI
ncbi:MAG: DUF4397 domain-containing protein, partial [Bacteroidetes bacterium]|nr:DUF4397 domain-containing protein [Bacteroidota bacterium]